MKSVVSVKPLEDFRLVVEFIGGEKRIADIKPLIARGGVFKPLGNKSVFDRVYLEYGAVTWLADGLEVDICPDKLYSDSVPIGEETLLQYND